MTSSPVTAAHVEPTLLRAANLVQLFPLLPDPRDPRGVRHRLEVILTLTAAAVVGGARSISAIGEFAQDVGADLLTGLGMPAAIPSEPTIRRLIETIDPAVFAMLLGSWMSPRCDQIDGQKVIAVDGKTVRRACARVIGLRIWWLRCRMTPAWYWARFGWIRRPTRSQQPAIYWERWILQGLW